jgi:hypothetical protein
MLLLASIFVTLNRAFVKTVVHEGLTARLKGIVQ